MNQLYISLFLLFSTIQIYAQDDYGWWVEKHNWDGVSPWNQYMTMSTSYMGPNALPVPGVTKGRVDSLTEVELSGSYYYSKGDETVDFYTRGYLPLFNDRMAVSLDVVPYEWFKTDTVTRDERAARTKSGEGGAGGDIYFYTEFQLVKNRQKMPDILFRAAMRIPSGTNLGNARHTDAPGYFFDVSAGKNYNIKKSIMRIYLMSGIYVYQTYDLQHLQNDCFLYGAGVDLNFKKVSINQSLAGYSGYLDIGDKPLVYTAEVRFKNKYFDWKFSYLWGLNDYAYQRFRAGVVFHLLL